MKITDCAREMIQELSHVVAAIDDETAEQFVEYILQANKIFVAGAGRSGLMGRAFAMRLMQMGFEAYVVGETVTPNLDKGDLLIVGTGSGETKTLLVMAEKARNLNASIAVVSIFPESTIGRLSNIAVQLPAQPKTGSETGYQSIQPMGALFEQSLMLFYDALILMLMNRQGTNASTMFSRHANLE
ncbi:6-phospho-3-hexuloisomerase [Alicyclobacillus acidiphilus]|uniref:6-phospho-3-hexuloisomerase n=1 Tax=Alicyclobacillus acidiphilus TaxID=182455 RepID=UPI00082EC665|nr:6-phospho-3-hexuloisomerase [Alicyclobacillus acidiphilus]